MHRADKSLGVGAELPHVARRNIEWYRKYKKARSVGGSKRRNGHAMEEMPLGESQESEGVVDWRAMNRVAVQDRRRGGVKRGEEAERIQE